MKCSASVCSFVLLVIGAGAVEAQVSGRVLSVRPDTLRQGSLGVPVEITVDDVSTDDVLRLQGPFAGSSGVRTDGIQTTPLQRVSGRRFAFLAMVSGSLPAGTYRFDVRDTTALPPMVIGSLFLEVVAGSTLSGPAAVSAVAVVHPRPGALLGRGEAVYPRGVLTVRGSGPITGSWVLDGVPFDRFVLGARGGEPLEVTSRLPMPVTTNGPHSLVLKIDSPATVASEPVDVIQTSPRTPLMRAVAPWPDAVMAAAPVADPPRFRWTLEPGAREYEVLLSRHAREMRSTSRFRAYSSPWTLPADAWAALEAGRWYWSVRPVYPGGVPGELLTWRALTLLPVGAVLTNTEATSDSEDAAVRLSWSGGVAGMLYRVELVRETEPERVLFHALTFEPFYRMPAALVLHDNAGMGRLLWQVRALGPGGVEIGRGEATPFPPVPSAALSTAAFLPASDKPSIEVVGQSPGEGQVVTELRPLISLHWNGFDDLEGIALLVDGSDMTGVSRLTSGTIEYRPAEDLVRGEHGVIVLLGNRVVQWSFRIGEVEGQAPGMPDDSSSAPAEGGTEPLDGASLDWRLDLNGEVIWLSGNGPDETDQGRAMLSHSLDGIGKSGRSSAGASGDISFRADFERGGSFLQESRRYALRGELGGDRWRGLASAGFFSPRSLDESTYMDTGLSRAGAELGVAGPLGTLTAYGDYDDRIDGQSSSVQGPRQQVLAAAYQPPLPESVGVIRIMGLDVTDRGIQDLGLERGEGRTYGLHGKFPFSEGWLLDLEAARSRTEYGLSENRHGLAYRVRVAGKVDTTSLDVEGWRNEADFRNLASMSLVPGSVPDRTGGSFGLSHRMGEASLDFGYRFLMNDRTSEGGAPDSNQHSVDLSYATLFSRVHQIAVHGDWSRDTSDRLADQPKATVDNLGASILFTEQAGLFTCSQTIVWQNTRDRSSDPPDFDPGQDTYSTAVTGSGALGRGWSLMGNVIWTRTDPASASGAETLTWILQPTWSTKGGGLSVAATIAQTRNHVERFPSARSRQAQLMGFWQVPGKLSGLGVTLTTEWREELNAGGLPGSSDDWRTTGSLSWSWGAPGGSSQRRMNTRPSNGMATTTIPEPPPSRHFFSDPGLRT